MTYIFDSTPPAFTSLAETGDASDGYINDAEKAGMSALWALNADGYTVADYTQPLDETAACDVSQGYNESSIARAVDFTAGDKAYVICVRLTDAAGNITYGKSDAVTRDIVAPIVSVGADLLANTTKTVNASVTGATTYQWSDVNASGHVSFTAATASSTNISADADGSYDIRLTATDAAGNSASDELQFTWDATSPNLGRFVKTGDASDGYVNDAEKNGITALWSLTGSSGHDSVSFTTALSNPASVTCDENQSYSESTIITAADLPNTDTSYVICVNLADAAGNNTYGKSEIIVRDIELPTVDVGSDIAINTVATINATVNGASSLQWTQTSGTGSITFSAPTAASTNVTTSDETTYVLRLTATDAAGNTAFDELSFLFSTTSPTLSSFIGANEASNGFVNNAEKDSALDLLAITASNYQTIKYTIPLADSSLTCDASQQYDEDAIPAISDLPAPDGLYAVCVKLEAAGGGTTYGKSQSIVKDTTAPDVEAGVNMTAGASPANINATVSGAASWAWTKVSGTGTITFGTPNAEDTTASASSQDSYVLRLTATDAAGNSAFDDMTLTWDTTAPVFTSLALAAEAVGGFINSTEASATNPLWTLSASGQSATAYTLPLDNTGDAVACNSEKTYGQSSIARAVDLTDGDKAYVICVRLTDNAGNVTYGKSSQVMRDTVAPSMTSFTGANEASNGYINGNEVASTNAMFAFVGTDVAIDDFTEVLADSALNCDGSKNYNQASIPHINTIPAMDGAYAVCAQVADAAGNIAHFKSQSITRDTGLPTVEVGSNITSNAAASITPTVNGATTYAWTKTSGAGTITFGSPSAANTTATASAQETYVLRLTVTDVAGNTAFDELTYIYDTAPPTFSSLALANEAIGGYINSAEAGATNPLWTLSATDNVATIYTAPLDDTDAAVLCNATQTYSPTSIARAVDLASGDKPYAICVRLTDAAGNIAYGKSAQVIRDTQGGTITSFMGANGASDGFINNTETGSGAAAFSLIAAGHVSDDFTAILDDDPAIVCDSEQTYGSANIPLINTMPATDGAYAVCVKLTDVAGNITYGKSQSIVRDAVAPVFTSLLSINGASDGLINSAETGSGLAAFTLNASGYSVDDYTTFLDNTPTITCDSGKTYSNADIPVISAIPATDENYAVCIRIADAAGNLVYGKSQAITRDTVAPPSLTAFTGAPDPDGQGIRLSFTFPASTADYASAEIRRLAGATAPSCATGTAVQTYTTGTGFTATSFVDTGLTAGNAYSYRVCIRDAAGNVTSSNNATNVKVSGEHAWDFSNAAHYTFNQLLVQIVSDLARLIGIEHTDNNNTATGFAGGKHLGTTWDNTNLALTMGAVNATTGIEMANSFYDGIDPSNLEYLLHFDGVGYTNGSTIVNTTGKPNGTLTTGDSNWKTVPGKYGKAIQFDGSNDQIVVANDVSNQFVGDFTFMAWIKIPAGSASSPKRILSKQFYGTNLFLFRVNGHKFEFGMSDNSGALYGLTGSTIIDDGQWHFLTARRSGSNLSIYVDGVLEGSRSVSTDMIGHPQTSLNIGSLNGTYEFFYGTIDEIAMFSRAVSDAEITTLYNSQIQRTRATAWDRNSRLNEGLVLLAHLDETSGAIADSSAYANTGTANGGAAYNQPGAIGKAMTFDGVDDYVSFGNAETLRFSNAFTGAAWVYPTSTTHTWNVIFGSELSYLLGIASDGRLIYALANSNPGWTWVYTNQTIPLNTWTHVAFSYDSSTGAVRAYVNGKNVYEFMGSGTVATNNQAWLGSRSSYASSVFQGSIDEFALWNRSLSPKEISSLYDLQKPGHAGNVAELPTFGDRDGFANMAGNVLYMPLNEWAATETRLITDYSGNDNNGTLSTTSDGLNNSVNGQLRSSLTFDGNDFITIPDAASLRPSQLSFGAWIKPTGATTRAIIGKSIAGTNNSFVAWLTTTNELRAQVCASAVSCAVVSAGKVDNDVWNHIIVTHDESLLKVYVNSRLISSVAAAFVKQYDTSPLTIGGDDENDDGIAHAHFRGVIDEAAIWSRVLSATEIETIYQRQAPTYKNVFESRIFDATAVVGWDSFSFMPDRPYGKELPDALAQETDYSAYNASGIDLMNGNVLLLHMNDSASPLVDTSGQNTNANVFNGAVFGQSAVFGTGVLFNGTNSFANLGAQAIHDMDDEMSISVWVNPTSLPRGENAIIHKDGEYDLCLTSSGEIKWAVGSSSPGWATMPTGAYVPLHRWSHITFTYSSILGAAKTYLNGNLVHTQAATGTIEDTKPAANELQLGQRQLAPGSHQYHGLMDELGLWRRALSATEAKELYLRGAARLQFQVRSCDAKGCDDEPWQGTNGTASTFLSEASNTRLSPSPFNFANFPSMNIDAGRFFQYRAFLSTNTTTDLPKVANVIVGSAQYSQDGEVVVNTGRTYTSLHGFTETSDGSGNVTYQISNNGTNWYYHNGTTWVAATTRTQSNSAAIVNTNIAAFGAAHPSGTFYFKAFLNSANGTQQTELDNVSVIYVP